MRLQFRSISAVITSWLAIGSTATMQAEVCNFFASNPGGCCFTLILAGDQTGNINVCKTCGDPGLNPFAGACPSSQCSMSTDGNTTSITYCGCQLPPGGRPHFGADGGTGSGVTVLGGYWSGCSGGSPSPGGPGKPGGLGTTAAVRSNALAHVCLVANAVASDTNRSTFDSLLSALRNKPLAAPGGSSLPFLSVINGEDPGPTPAYFTAFVRGTPSPGDNSQEVGTWYSSPYLPGGTVWIVNSTSNPIALNEVGVLPNDKLRDIHDLNFGVLPPPDYPNSPFMAVSSLNGVLLQPGEKVQLIPIK